MRRGGLWCVLAGLVGSLAGGGLTPVLAQMQVAEAGPRFLAAGSERDAEARDVRNAAVFVRRISVDIHELPLGQALAAVARQGGLNLTISPGVVDVDTKVSFSASGITVGGALTGLLYGLGVDVRLASDGVSAAIVPRPGRSGELPRQPTAVGGSISGSVTDSATKETVPGVVVSILETGQSTKSNGQGQYTMAGVPAGEYHVKVMRVGFIVKTRIVEVRDGATSTLNFALNRPATILDQVVTTGAGDERRFTLGNEITTVNVDSIVPTAPVTSVTDVLTARVPGVQIVENSGLAGSGEAIRIWGQSSALLQSDPIIIVDGVRQDNSPGGLYVQGFVPLMSPSRLNDIDFSQIESIDVLKGPAASTEYGTDAANGVIVIKTKRGQAGKPQWHATIEDGANTIPYDYPDFYYSYGHLISSGAAVECPFVANPGAPQQSGGSCAVDSIVHGNPLTQANTTPYRTGSRQKYDLDVGGGTDAIRYYLAGGLTNDVGAMQVPAVFVPGLQAAGFPQSAYSPNSDNQRTGRANTFIQLSKDADLTVTAAYMSTFASLPNVGGLVSGAAQGGSLDAANNYGYGFANDGPGTDFGYTQTQQNDRFTGGLTANWRPASWITASADAGIDHGTQTDVLERLPQLGAYLGFTGNVGQYTLVNASTDVYSADARVALTASLASGVRAVTTVGGNMRDTRQASLESQASGLSAENMSLVGNTIDFSTQTGSRSATLGGYGEEQLQLFDQLYVTGAIRADGASGFGPDYQVALYPKASVSWLAVQHGPTTVRVRGAFGASGVQPYNGLTLPMYTPVSIATTTGTVSGTQMTQPGNPDLKPERSAEWEGGVDIGLWNNRVSIELTGYEKTTTDALYTIGNLGGDLNYFGQTVNIGEITNNGLEATITAAVLHSSMVDWTVTLNASTNHNKLVHLAPGLPDLTWNGQAQRITPGYPLYGFWGTRYTYADQNHDGMLEPNEITVDTGASYLGSSIPTQQAALSTHWGFLHNTLSVGMVFTYQGGYRVYDQFAQTTDQYGTTPGLNVPGPTSLADQARYLAQISPNACCNAAGYFPDGTVYRFQELSVTYALPPAWARAVRVHSLSVTGAARNLAYWTRYPDGDPSAGYSTQSGTTVGTTSFVNNDIRASGTNAVPLARYYQVRLNVGF